MKIEEWALGRFKHLPREKVIKVVEEVLDDCADDIGEGITFSEVKRRIKQELGIGSCSKCRGKAQTKCLYCKSLLCYNCNDTQTWKVFGWNVCNSECLEAYAKKRGLKK